MAVAGVERFRDVPDKNQHSHVAEALEYLLIGSGEGRPIIRKSTTHRPALARQAELPDGIEW